MKASLSRGSSFGGLARYVVDSKKQAEVVGGTMVSTDAKSLTKEFGLIQALRPDIKKQVWHCSLALPAGEEPINTNKWNDITTDFMGKMGFSQTALYTAFRHQDTDCDHVHIIASRIDLDGSVWLGKQDMYLAMDVTQELEKKYGLTLTPAYEGPKNKANPTQKEVQMMARTEKLAPKVELQAFVDDVMKNKHSAKSFCEALENHGVKVCPNITSTGKLNGFSFAFAGGHFSGTQLGQNYKFKNLQDRGLEYIKDRDFASLMLRKIDFGVSTARTELLGLLDKALTESNNPENLPVILAQMGIEHSWDDKIKKGTYTYKDPKKKYAKEYSFRAHGLDKGYLYSDIEKRLDEQTKHNQADTDNNRKAEGVRKTTNDPRRFIQPEQTTHREERRNNKAAQQIIESESTDKKYPVRHAQPACSAPVAAVVSASRNSSNNRSCDSCVDISPRLKIWQMSRKEFASATKDYWVKEVVAESIGLENLGLYSKGLRKGKYQVFEDLVHEQAVFEAYEAGENIPPLVLADYPELHPTHPVDPRAIPDFEEDDDDDLGFRM